MAITKQEMKSSFEMFDGQNKMYHDLEDDTYHSFDEIKLIGGGVSKWFSGFSRDSLLGYEEASWSKQPARSSVAPFSMTTINDVEFYSIAILEVTFPIISYVDFIELQKVLHQRTVDVIFFNVYRGEWMTREMTTTGNERGALHNFGLSIGGIKQVKVKFVATNNGLAEYNNESTVTITYNGGTPIAYDVAEQVVIGDGYNGDFYSCTDTDGSVYYKGQSITLFKSLNLTLTSTTSSILTRLQNINNGNITIL